MSRENADVLRAVVGALNRRDHQAMIGLTHEDLEWRPALTVGGSLEGRVYRGADGVSRYLRDLDAEFADTRVEIESMEPLDESRLLYRGRVTARGRASGVELDVPIWAVWEFRGGRIYRGHAFQNEADALEAAGRRS